MLQQLVLETPVAAADLVRTALLATTRPNPDLTGRTSTGGTLDIAAAQQWLLRQCDADDEPLRIASVYPMPATDQVTLVTNRSFLEPTITVSVYDALGRLVDQPTATLHYGRRVELSFATAQLPAGWYFARLQQPGENTVTASILVR